MPSPIRVLAVDDDKLFRMDLSLVLGREGYAVDTASCVDEARAMLESAHYEVVLTDVGLPDASGLEVLRCAKSIAPDTQVILVTGSATGVTEEQAIAAGALAFMLKPFPMQDLLNEVRRAVDLPSPFPPPAAPSSASPAAEI